MNKKRIFSRSYASVTLCVVLQQKKYRWRVKKKNTFKKNPNKLRTTYLRSIAGSAQAIEQPTSAAELGCSMVVQTHFAQPLEQALSQGFVQPLRTRPRKAAMDRRASDEKCSYKLRTSDVQARVQASYKDRVFSDSVLEQGFEQGHRTRIRTSSFEQPFEQRSSNKLEQGSNKEFLSMKYSSYFL